MRFIYFKARQYLLLILGISLIACGIFLNFLPDIRGVEKGVMIQVQGKGKNKIERFVSPLSGDFVFSSKLPRHVTGAIIVSEDEDFYSHNGISMDEILQAVQFDIKYRTLKHGGSTITQQVVKNVYLSGERKFSRKIIEAITALRLEKKLSKKQILDYYINIAEFGSGIYGIGQASEYYFNKTPEELTPREAAMLAVTLPKPKARGQALLAQDKDGFQKKRVQRLLARMKEHGYIS